MAVKEEQIDSEPRVIDTESFLSPKEGEVISKLNQEVGEMLNQGFFKIRL